MQIPRNYTLDTETPLPGMTVYRNGKILLYIQPHGAKLTARVDQVDLTIGPFAWPTSESTFQVFEAKLLMAREAALGVLG
jgi:hypothetical protein